jgi:hypothetical protein
VQTTATASGLGAGTYTVTVTDANGCSDTEQVTITQPTAVVASIAAPTNVSCNGGSNGSATASGSGGTGAYSFSWNTTPVQTTATASGLGAGTYTVTVTDANGCSDTEQVTITQPTAVTLGLQVEACSSGHDGQITASFGGGTGPYAVDIDGGGFTAFTSPHLFTGLTQGSHTVTVRDANQCSLFMSITIPQCEQQVVSYCALTQGAYGNSGGVFTHTGSIYTNLPRFTLIRALLGDPSTLQPVPPNPQSLILGVFGTRSLTIPLSAAQCIITRLPAGGTPTTLPNFAAYPPGTANRTLNDPNASVSCQVTKATNSSKDQMPLSSKGKFDNVLVGQVITLGFNMRLDPTLPGLNLSTIGTPVVVQGRAYRQFCTQGMNSDGTPKVGDIRTLRIPQTVIDALSNPTIITDPTHLGNVAGLLDLANRALAGMSTGFATISDVNAAVDAINGGFDECRSLVDCPTQ